MNATAAPTSSNRGFLLGIVALVVVGLAVVAFVATRGGDDGDIALAEEQTASVSSAGEPLEPLAADVRVGTVATDPVVGQQAPTLELTDFAGESVTIGPDGRAKVVYFLAHWCSHCQSEVPVLQKLIDDGTKPDNLDIYAVSTAVDAGRGNYPPQAWLEREGFAPVIGRDDAASAAFQAFGGSGFPYAVYLDADNNVVARTAGQVEPSLIAELWELTGAG